MPARRRLRRLVERGRTLRAFCLYVWSGSLEQLFRIGESQDRMGLADEARREGEADDPFASAALVGLWERRYCPERYDVAELLGLPAETLGGAYARHMTSRGLRPDFYDAVEPRDRNHYLRLRLRQTHDVWHVLTGFDTTLPGELGLQGFYQGQCANGLPALVLARAILAGSFTGGFGEMLQGVDAFCEGHRTGRMAQSLLAVEWEQAWTEPLRSLREQYRIEWPRCRAGLI